MPLQVGVRQELQDEEGAVMGMKVGERRRFAVPQELAFKRKAFGQPVPPNQVCMSSESVNNQTLVSYAPE